MAGTLKIKHLQLGDNATATQNFVFRENSDGTATLARGNVGATTQDILTIDASGNVKSPINNPGSAPVFGCRAWCNFDGTLTGTFSPTSGGNVTSITRNSTGDYTVNFTTALPDANYAVSAFAGNAAGGANRAVANNATLTSGSIRIIVSTLPQVLTDSSLVTLAVFR